MSETIYESDYAKYLPQPLANDPKMVALAKTMAEELLEVSGEMKTVLIYSRIDELPEELIDILAYDLLVDWYDYSYSLKEKRELLKSSVHVHKKMGTKYAVEKALSALYPNSRIEEWFEYGGMPGYFRLSLELTKNMETAELADIVNKINIYKRLSAHLEEIIIKRRFTGKIFIGNAMSSLIQISVKAKRHIQESRQTDKMYVGIAKSEHVKIKF